MALAISRWIAWIPSVAHGETLFLRDERYNVYDLLLSLIELS